MATLTDLTLEELRARAMFFGGVYALLGTWGDKDLQPPQWRLAQHPRKYVIMRKYPIWFDSEREALCAYLSEMKAHHYPDRLPDTVTAR